MIEISWDVRPTSLDIFELYLKLKKEKPNEDMTEDMQAINAHASGADHQTLVGGGMQQENTDQVADTGCGDR